jgi:glycosyltransferase involved in cell wall biosynthesis
VLAVAGAAVGIVLFYVTVLADLPEINSLQDYRPNLITRVLDVDGNEIASFAKERRVIIPIEQVPKHVVDAFIAASEAIRQMLVADGVPAERAVTVHEGIDVDHVVAAPPVNVHEAFWLPHQAPVVGNVAALVPHKGQRHLIEAAHLVVREMPDARFVILGEGELREPLERQVREYHLEKHVLLPGFRTDVLGCIKGFDLFVLSSVTEGLGSSLLDAMACSRAIAATTAGGIPEVVVDGENGLLVPPRDHAALAGAIVRLLNDQPLRRQMGEAGLARVRSRFTVERMVAGTAAAYAEVKTQKEKLERTQNS